jgi:phage shock protein PspC (stress-responsive transcriptional regulator)/DNA-binding XRE family transcriptional regulator
MGIAELGIHIADRRKAQGLSQDGLAYLSKVDVRTVQRIEAGCVRPHPHTMKSLAQALGCTPVSLSESVGKVTPSGQIERRFWSIFRRQKGDFPMKKKENVLQRLAKSKSDRMIAGVCGGLGDHTGIPSWIWRIVFLASVLLKGAGILAYVLLWIFIPTTKAPVRKEKSARPNWLQRLARSSADRKIGGVCGGLGEATPVPSWCWRLVFTGMVFVFGTGLIAYALFWVFMPRTASYGRASLATQGRAAD